MCNSCNISNLTTGSENTGQQQELKPALDIEDMCHTLGLARHGSMWPYEICETTYQGQGRLNGQKDQTQRKCVVQIFGANNLRRLVLCSANIKIPAKS